MLQVFCLMSDFKVAKKVTDQLLNLTEDKEISESEMQALLKKVFKNGKGKNTKTRIMEAVAIAAYQRQSYPWNSTGFLPPKQFMRH